MLTIIKVIILLGILIIIHEFAHLTVAKLCGVKILEFSIGFGPLLLKKGGKETTYSIRLIPLGGYVNMFGMDDKNCKQEGSYQNLSTFKKILILLAGSFVNILFGLIIYFILILHTSGIEIALQATNTFLFSLFDSIKMLFTGAVTPDQLIGPIGITELVGKTEGIKEFIYLTALISLSLGITNLLPVPPLDGSKIVIVLFEKIINKQLKEETEIIIQFIGFVLLLMLSIYVAYNDIIRAIGN